MVDKEEEDRALFPERAGDRLRAARIKAGLDLSDVASRTRIPLRHLQSIESGDYSAFPSSTYCIGFVKAYARAVGDDEHEIAQQLRIELGHEAHGYRTELHDYDDADPARIPSRTLAWTAVAIAVLLAIGYGVWRSMALGGPEVAPALVEPVRPPSVVAPAPAPALPAASEVVLTAVEPVWVRIYDASDKVLFEKEMAKGERYTVPPDANNPMIRTGRAELIAVTLNGSAVAPLGPAERTVKDVEISAAALAARSAAVAPGSAVASPDARASQRPAPPASVPRSGPTAAVPSGAALPAPPATANSTDPSVTEP